MDLPPSSTTGVARVTMDIARNQFYCITLSIWERIFIIYSSDKYDRVVSPAWCDNSRASAQVHWNEVSVYP